MARSRPSSDDRRPNRYAEILLRVFRSHYTPGTTEFVFARTELETAAADLGVVLPRNLGDLIYSFRYRTAMPDEITATATGGLSWVIEPAGRSLYRMKLARENRIVPNPSLIPIKIPDATPQIVTAHALTDEQALLAKVRYNRLIDIFLRVTAYSLQNHLRSAVPDLGQIETDEVYVAVRNTGQQFVVPVQAKGGTDQIGAIQVRQDLALCRRKFPALTPRPVAVQFTRDAAGEVIAMFELAEADGNIGLVEERHYRLVPASYIGADDLARMAAGDA